MEEELGSATGRTFEDWLLNLPTSSIAATSAFVRPITDFANPLDLGDWPDESSEEGAEEGLLSMSPTRPSPEAGACEPATG